MFMVNASTVVTTEDASGFYVTLDISQYRDDVLIDKRVVEDDYILRNLVYVVLNMLSGHRSADASADYRPSDLDNVAVVLSSKIYLTPTYASIRLGTGVNAVAVTNYKLQTEVLSQQVDDGTIWVTGNEFNVTADTTIVSDGSYSLTEAGLVAGVGIGAPKYVLICRDVFAPIAVINGDVIVVRYIFRFNVGL